MKTRFAVRPLALALSLASTALFAADVDIRNPWVRGTVSGQMATGAFLEITSQSGAVLVGATTPVAGVTEIHEMKMEGSVMQMRPVPRLELPAGKTVVLAPGGYHVMLMDLKRPLKKGEVVPLTLRLEGRDRKTETIEVRAEVRDLTAAPTH
ncbi:MAG TPA: copper chaperone PCu(A)C [Accumulibacter sp.]|nr:copper chaperone PCu(A)C [Accumulibacter sp.]